MAKPERKARERRYSSSSYFLRCFGISRKIHSDKTIVDDDTSLETQRKKKKTSRTRWFSRSKEITRKSSNESKKQNLVVEDYDDEKKKTMFRVIRHVSDLQDIASLEENNKEKDTNQERDVNPDPLSLSGHYDACPDQVTTIVHVGKLDRTITIRSESKQKELKEKSSRVRKGSRAGNFDPVIGITIIMLTLVMMLIWGRLCAILCASTWCYFLPRLKEVATTTAERKRRGDDKVERGQRGRDLDLNSEAYKKKVVLDGFLFRQHRVSF